MIYKLSAKVTISLYTEVDADTLEEAIEIANQRHIEQSNYDGDNANEAWISSEFDGEPYNVSHLEGEGE